MVDRANGSNEWLVIELRQCRSILGVSQKTLSELTGMALQSIKRLEKKGANPRYSTVLKLRSVFDEMGVSYRVSDKGVIESVLSEALVLAINEGRVKEYTDKRVSHALMLRDEIMPESK